jgi:hypothetical protein
VLEQLDSADAAVGAALAVVERSGLVEPIFAPLEWLKK